MKWHRLYEILELIHYRFRVRLQFHYRYSCCYYCYLSRSRHTHTLDTLLHFDFERMSFHLWLKHSRIFVFSMQFRWLNRSSVEPPASVRHGLELEHELCMCVCVREKELKNGSRHCTVHSTPSSSLQCQATNELKCFAVVRNARDVCSCFFCLFHFPLEFVLPCCPRCWW